MRRFALLLTPLLALTACEQLEDLEETVSGLTNPVVVQGIYLGVAQPDNDEVDLSGTDYGSGARITAFLAEADGLDSIEETPISDEDVQIATGAGSLTLTDKGFGRYEATGDDGLAYTKDDYVSLSTNYNGALRSVSLTTPAAPETSLDTAIAPGSALGVDLSGQGFDSALVIVFDPDGGVVFSNLPSGLKELYELTHGGGEVAFDIPGEAFSEKGLYMVGVAGLVNAGAEDLSEVNTALSTFTAGKLRFSVVCATDNETLGDLCE